MKKQILLLAGFLLMGVSAFAQYFEFHYPKGSWSKISDTLFINADEAETDDVTGSIKTYIGLKNITTDDKEAQIIGKYMNDFGGNFVSYCYGSLCPATGYPTSPFHFAAGQLIDNFYIDFTNQENGTFLFELEIYNSTEISENEKLIVKYVKTEGNNIKEPVKYNNLKVDIYPNPATDNVKIKYDLGKSVSSDSKVIIRNLVGAVVKTIPLKETQKELMVSISDLSSGIYFYSLSVDGVIHSTKKLIVKR